MTLTAMRPDLGFGKPRCELASFVFPCFVQRDALKFAQVPVRVHSSVRCEIDLSGQQARQQQVARSAEILDLRKLWIMVG